MSSVNPRPLVKRKTELNIRVRYKETDGQGRVHHANYSNYFEMGRVEMLRESGYSYRDLEDSGLMLVVTQLTVNYHQGALFDDLLRLVTTVIRAKGVRVKHKYEIYRDDELICDGETTVACIDREGNIKRLPDWLKVEPGPAED